MRWFKLIERLFKSSLNKNIITILAEKLIDKEVVEGDEVEEIINTYKNTELDNIEL